MNLVSAQYMLYNMTSYNLTGTNTFFVHLYLTCERWIPRLRFIRVRGHTPPPPLVRVKKFSNKLCLCHLQYALISAMANQGWRGEATLNCHKHMFVVQNMNRSITNLNIRSKAKKASGNSEGAVSNQPGGPEYVLLMYEESASVEICLFSWIH
jgi:hypothetical protein